MEDTSSLEIKTHEDATEFVTLRGYLNCLEQEDPKLIDNLKENYIRYFVREALKKITTFFVTNVTNQGGRVWRPSSHKKNNHLSKSFSSHLEHF